MGYRGVGTAKTHARRPSGRHLIGGPSEFVTHLVPGSNASRSSGHRTAATAHPAGNRRNFARFLLAVRAKRIRPLKDIEGVPESALVRVEIQH